MDVEGTQPSTGDSGHRAFNPQPDER